MVHLLDLSCKSCHGGTLKFVKGVAECSYCHKSYALVSDGKNDGKVLVGYRPLEQNSGKMQIPLKIRVADLLKEGTKLLVVDDYVFEQYLEIVDGEVVYTDGEISADNRSLKILKGIVIKSEFSKFGLFTGVIKSILEKPGYAYLFCINVEEVEDENGLIVGESVKIEVQDRKYQAEAENISAQIEAEFGVVPTVRLVKG